MPLFINLNVLFNLSEIILFYEIFKSIQNQSNVDMLGM